MEWWNWATVGLGAVGAVLGIRAELWRRSERQREKRKSYAHALVQLRPVLADTKRLPIRLPSDLTSHTAADLLEMLEGIDKTLKEATPSVLSSMPHLFESVDRMTSAIDQVRSVAQHQTPNEQATLVAAFEGLFAGARLLTLFEEYKGLMLNIDKSSNLNANPHFQDFQERHRAFSHERIILNYAKDA